MGSVYSRVLGGRDPRHEAPPRSRTAGHALSSPPPVVAGSNPRDKKKKKGSTSSTVPKSSARPTSETSAPSSSRLPATHPGEHGPRGIHNETPPPSVRTSPKRHPSNSSPKPPTNATPAEKPGRSLTAVLCADKNKTLIKEHVITMAERTLACRAAFENVSKLLSLFDNRKSKTKDNLTTQDLRPGWDELYKRYDTLLRASRSDAVVVKAVCDDFLGVILGALKDPRMSSDDIKNEAKKFIERTEKSEEKLQSSAEGFDNLRNQVELYHANIETTLSSASARSSISELRKSIRSLKVEIIKTQLSIVERVSGPAITSVSASNVVFALCPELGESIASEMRLQKSSSLEKLKSELHGKEETFGRLRSREKQLKKYITYFNASEGALQGVITHAAALSNFWESVRADCQSATRHLDNVHTKQTAEFGTRDALGTELTSSVYLMLSETLATYVAQLASLRR